MEEIKELYYESFRKINFVERFERFLEKYRDFEYRMTKLDNKEVKRVFAERGYKVKIFTPGQDFYFEEFFGDYKFHFEVTKKGGIIQSRIDLYFRGEKPDKIDTNLYFLYRLLINDMNLEIAPPICFTSIEEFEQILIELLSIYKDFKVEFLSQIEGNGLS